MYVNRSGRRLLDGSTRQLTVLTATTATTTPQDMDKSQCSPSNDSITNSSQQINQTQPPVHPLTPSSCLAIRRPTTNMLVFLPTIFVVVSYLFRFFECFLELRMLSKTLYFTNNLLNQVES